MSKKIPQSIYTYYFSIGLLVLVTGNYGMTYFIKAGEAWQLSEYPLTGVVSLGRDTFEGNIGYDFLIGSYVLNSTGKHYFSTEQSNFNYMKITGSTDGNKWRLLSFAMLPLSLFVYLTMLPFFFKIWLKMLLLFFSFHFFVVYALT